MNFTKRVAAAEEDEGPVTDETNEDVGVSVPFLCVEDYEMDSREHNDASRTRCRVFARKEKKCEACYR